MLFIKSSELLDPLQRAQNFPAESCEASAAAKQKRVQRPKGEESKEERIPRDFQGPCRAFPDRKPAAFDNVSMPRGLKKKRLRALHDETWKVHSMPLIDVDQ